MSEKQKRMAKRIVEILIESGVLERRFRGSTRTFQCEMREMDWIHELTHAIALYQAEELEKDLQKLRELNRKTVE